MRARFVHAGAYTRQNKTSKPFEWNTHLQHVVCARPDTRQPRISRRPDVCLRRSKLLWRVSRQLLNSRLFTAVRLSARHAAVCRSTVATKMAIRANGGDSKSESRCPRKVSIVSYQPRYRLPRSYSSSSRRESPRVPAQGLF